MNYCRYREDIAWDGKTIETTEPVELSRLPTIDMIHREEQNYFEQRTKDHKDSGWREENPGTGIRAK